MATFDDLYSNFLKETYGVAFFKYTFFYNVLFVLFLLLMISVVFFPDAGSGGSKV